MKLPSFDPRRCIGSLLAAAVFATVLLGSESKAQNNSPVHFLFQSDFSDHYITPRGLDVENQGLVYQPLLLALWDIYTDKDALLSGVSLTAGMWSSIHENESGKDPGHWNEWDPILGLTFSFKDYLKFETNYTAFESKVDSYDTSHHLELKLKLDDSKWLKEFALNPYIAFWKELDNKSTVVFDFDTSRESYYFTVGVNPTAKLGPVKVELPTSINIVDNQFYQTFEGEGGGSGIAVFGTELKGTVPLSFIPSSWGFWSAYAGVKYYHLSNDGLLDGNEVLGATGERKKDLVQFHTGLTIFF